MKWFTLKWPKLFFLISVSILVLNAAYSQQYLEISESELKQKIKGYWIDQLAGNYMGWPFKIMYSEGAPILTLNDRYYTEMDKTLGLNIHIEGLPLDLLKTQIPRLLK